MISSQTIYLPGRLRRDEHGAILPDQSREPSEPAPALLTEEQVMRLFQLDLVGDKGAPGSESTAAYKVLKQWRDDGILRAWRWGNTLRYPLSECIRVMERLTEGARGSSPGSPESGVRSHPGAESGIKLRRIAR